MYKKCKNCKRIYWRDIKSCLYCKSNSKLELIFPKIFKVIGITTVNIPSREHMRVPYYILLLKNEFGHTSIKKTYKEHKINTILRQRKLSKDNYIICSKMKYIKKSAVFNVLHYLEKKLKNIQIDINLVNCKPKDKFEAGQMPSKYITNSVFEYLDKHNIDNNIIKNEYIDLIKLKYPQLSNFKNKIEGKLTLKIVTIDNLKVIKQENNTIYLIDANFLTINSTLKKSSLLFATNNLKLFKEFLENKHIYEKTFYGEETEIIQDELKYLNFN